MKRALVIEDQADNMVLICRLLEKYGYSTIQATSGLAGVELALKERPDFIILDIQLPDVDGIEVLRRIRAEAGSHVPVIAMTSYAMAGDRERLLAAGCDGYIEKPINTKVVVSQIEQVIRRRGVETGHGGSAGDDPDGALVPNGVVDEDIDHRR